MNPYVRGAGMAKSIYDMGAAGARKIGKNIARIQSNSCK
jgi:hypothetical protein